MSRHFSFRQRRSEKIKKTFDFDPIEAEAIRLGPVQRPANGSQDARRPATNAAWRYQYARPAAVAANRS
jgi:hypothetical protein